MSCSSENAIFRQKISCRKDFLLMEKQCCRKVLGPIREPEFDRASSSYRCVRVLELNIVCDGDEGRTAEFECSALWGTAGAAILVLRHLAGPAQLFGSRVTTSTVYPGPGPLCFIHRPLVTVADSHCASDPAWNWEMLNKWVCIGKLWTFTSYRCLGIQYI